MSQRIFLTLLLLFTLHVTASAADSPRRPNIVFAFADDWGRYASAYAKLDPGGLSDAVSTPNFDRIANEGVLFTNAYVNAPSCTPCRSSLLSGQYFWRTGRGAILQGAIWDDSIPSYPLLLEKSGYHIGHTYKVWSPGSPANAPYGANRTAYNKRGSKFNRFSQYVSAAKDTEKAKQELYDEVLGNFQDFLDARPEDAPFCYWFGPTNCHRTWVRGSGKELWGIDPDSLEGKLPQALPDVPIVREDFADYLGEAQAFDTALGVLLKRLEEIGELENTIFVVSGDHGVPGMPRGKCNLYDLGTQVALAVRWGKHIPQGRIVHDFVCLPDLAPTFLEAGGVEIPDVMTAKSVMNVLASDKSGFVDPSRNYVIVGRERHVAAVRDDYLPYPQRAIRTANYLYIHNFKPDRWPMGFGPGYGQPLDEEPTEEQLTNNTFVAFGDLDASPTKAWIFLNRKDPEVLPYFNFAFALRPQEELFDIQADPHQLHNLANDPKHAQAKQELKDQLMTVLKETKDPRVMGDGSTFDKSPYSDPFTRNKR